MRITGSLKAAGTTTEPGSLGESREILIALNDIQIPSSFSNSSKEAMSYRMGEL